MEGILEDLYSCQGKESLSRVRFLLSEYRGPELSYYLGLPVTTTREAILISSAAMVGEGTDRPLPGLRPFFNKVQILVHAWGTRWVDGDFSGGLRCI